MIHSQGFSVVNEGDVFLEFTCFLHNPTNVRNLISGSSAFSKASLYIWKFSIYILLKPNQRILSISLLAYEMSTTAWQFEHSLALPFFGTEVKTDLFQYCSHCWVFQICWHIECSTLTVSSFRIWNSSARILSPPLPLVMVMLPKAHLTSHSSMSGSRWVTTSSWLSGLLRPFLYGSSVYSCYLFLMCSSLHEMFCWYLQFVWRDL